MHSELGAAKGSSYGFGNLSDWRSISPAIRFASARPLGVKFKLVSAAMVSNLFATITSTRSAVGQLLQMARFAFHRSGTGDLRHMHLRAS